MKIDLHGMAPIRTTPTHKSMMTEFMPFFVFFQSRFFSISQFSLNIYHLESSSVSRTQLSQHHCIIFIRCQIYKHKISVINFTLKMCDLFELKTNAKHKIRNVIGKSFFSVPNCYEMFCFRIYGGPQTLHSTEL